MKKTALLLTALFTCLLLAGCSSGEETESPEVSAPPVEDEVSIPFSGDQLYAAAHLGYQDLGELNTFVEQQYLENDLLPVHYISDGDYYLVIPRYPGTVLALYRNDIDTGNSTLVFEDPQCGPFLLQCNVSDIFADATVLLSYEGQTAEFSPFISLMDGTVDIGENGLNMTMEDGGVG